MIQLKKKNIIMLALFVMCMSLTSTVNAVPIYNFNVVENISDTIIGGNNNDLIVEYNSEDIDVTYLFEITSPYQYLNNTPEIRYVRVIVDNTELVCTNNTILNDTVFVTLCNHHLGASHHNTTISFQFATNIMPDNYMFEFGMLHSSSTEPIILYRSGGSGSSYTYPNINKTFIIEVVREWLTPLPLKSVDDDEEYNETDEKYDDTGGTDEYVNDTIQNDTTSDDVIDYVDEDDNNHYIYFIIFGVIICIIIIWLMKKEEKTK